MYNVSFDCDEAQIDGNLGIGHYQACSFAFSYDSYDEDSGEVTGSKFLGSKCVAYDIVDKLTVPMPTQEPYDPDFVYTPKATVYSGSKDNLPVEDIKDKATIKDIIKSTKETVNDDDFFKAFLAKESSSITPTNVQEDDDQSIISDTVFWGLSGAIIATAGVLSYIAASLLKS